MAKKQPVSRLAQAAVLVDQLIHAIETEGLSRSEAAAAAGQVLGLVQTLSLRGDPDAHALKAALGRLAERLSQAKDDPTAPEVAVAASTAGSRFAKRLRRLAMIVTAGAVLSAPLAAAAHESAGLGAHLAGSSVAAVALMGALPVYAVGDAVLNPVTGSNEQVVEVIAPAAVRTASGNIIFLATTVGDTYTNTKTGKSYEVTAVTKNADNRVISVTVKEVGTSTTQSQAVVTDKSGDIVTGAPPAGSAGAGAGSYSFPTASGDIHTFADARHGSNGDNGDDGGGLEICIPLIGCATIGYNPTAGEDGENGPSFSHTITTANNGDIQVVSDKLPGIVVSSVGGDGGQGGDAYGNMDAARGGKAGAGGNVTLTSSVTIVTDGVESHGIFAQSRSGVGGDGGTGYIFSGGGSGGSPGQGGSVTVTSTGTISTSKEGAIGILAQSLGGAAGNGGDSYGIVGDGGGGSFGGDGGAVSVTQGGIVHTAGRNAHGVLAQSIGGSGGSAGDSIGLVTFGDSGAAGGKGGSATITASAGSSTTTSGDGAYALFAQSVGGGGGSGGLGIGVVSLGSDGGTGGDAGLAKITVGTGAIVGTTGAGSHAIVAQSVGGGGGSAGVAGGVVALGGKSSSGGKGGTVEVSSDGDVTTDGLDARGVFAQSVGGGGGAASGTGGLVALGGEGAAGGAGGSVTVTTGANGSVKTTKDGSDAIFAQSVGGGGGSGSSSGGVVALGGTAGGGGAGGTVGVTNGGEVETKGDKARGIFAQSVGGGGGTGGDGGGLATLGGTGGAASAGGDVTVTNTGSITTGGALSSGIQAQSVGGGGGDGGSTGGVFLTIGGGGSTGGASGKVTVAHSGEIFTGGNDSHGIFAQSVGGGGGNGGSSVSISAFAGVAIGGEGSVGGDGGTVDIDLTQSAIITGGSTAYVDPLIVTGGERSRGIFAQSVGGGGGSGGFAAQVSAGYGVGASAAVGGKGGAGGDGGLVDIDGAVRILTTGNYSEGLFAQSVGGGGGSGGFALSFSFAAGETAAAAFSVALGGKGGDGGLGGTVDIDSGGAIVTEGDFATGLVAQSVGGGGGNGGFTVAFAGAAAGAASASAAVGVGGAGGKGGDGGTVDVDFDGTIATEGDDAIGALIQSVGGGGGGGGFNVSGAIAVAGTAGVGASAGVGGTGGDGGIGGSATGRIGDDVTTEGDRSTAVIVQSVGGGGGSGGFNVNGSIGGGGTVGVGVAVGVGGSGGGGGDAGAATGTVVGDIWTKGEQSGGLLVQSVGGGGGSGGFNVSGSMGFAQTVGGGVSVGVGGAGGGGGAGGLVVATMIGDVLTEKADSDGIVAQSIGGGGGSGGFNVSGSIGGAGSVAGAVSVGIGGAGGDGGDAAKVTLDVTGATGTKGARSDAIIAQSVGGGGGSGGLAIGAGIALSGNGAGTISVAVGGAGGGGGDAGIVELRVNEGVADPLGDLIAAVTEGEGARAIVAQSVGGGGGSGGFTIAGGLSAAKSGAGNIGVGVGGGGGDGGNASSVLGKVTGDVGTKGADASAVLVQSVGGGGGSGGFNVTGGISASKSVAGNILVGVGGYGGAGGNAGDVTGGVTGDIVTEGDRAFGASYQSLGGGGGSGGFNITGGISLAASGGGTGTLGVGVGGFGGDGGDAGLVNATLTGDISTKGADAHGALLQSVGGSGGSGGFNITGTVSASAGTNGAIGFGLGGFGGGGGNASTVDGVLTGDVTTVGDNSFGAMLQSLGGGGGNGGMNVTGSVALSASNSAAVSIGLGLGGFGGGGGDAKAVTGSVTGRYQTSGDEADGVVAQSIGGGGGSGGLNVSGAVAVSAGTAGTASVGIGGFGGSGGDSGAVTLTRVGDTITDGANSDGIIAQSVAGGGGQGGINVSGGLSATTKGSAGSFGFGLGGFGGDGGDAGDVTASVTGNVWAQGLESDITTPEITIPIPLLGMNWTIPADRTRLNGSNGVVAQSVGGGGGSGGLNVTGQLSLTTPGGSSASRAISLGVGGFGGAGGDAGKVDLTIAGPSADYVQVTAVGDDRYAAVAQSIGGGGGAGAINVSGGVALDGQLTVGIGGFGGDGGLGKDVTADVTANLFAAGDRSRGLMAQSIGGGGGAGGINISGGISADTSGTEPSVVFGLGGSGGAGNASGDVTVAQDGQVWVEGVDAIGILVQSVAGGGGSGGLNVAADVNLGKSTSSSNGYSVAVGIGGDGGTGADAGDVSLTSVGDVIVNAQLKANPAAGEDRLEAVEFTGGAKGVLVQSIGGGGGVGGISATGAIAPFGNPITVGVGGSGGSGGNAGSVTVVRGYADDGSADPHLIRTFGDDSDGLIAQSIGGGGGTAGMNFTIAATVANKAENPIAAIITIGGDGAGAGSGDTVDVTHNGNIVTDGAHSDGLMAQSVGGGGGSGNFNIGAGVLKDANALNMAIGGATGAAGDGGDVSVDHVGAIVTLGDDSVGLRAQSIGGGGGNTGLDMAMGPLNRNEINITIGRLGGTGGVGGKVDVTSKGAIDTTGDESSAIFAQSVGGGGGASSATTVSATGTRGQGDNAESFGGAISVGLDGGLGAEGGDVTVRAEGTLTTRGDESRGIFAQSLGGGGGVGGGASNTIVRASAAAAVAVGGAGGVGAISGSVEVDNAATIVTEGARSDGILAQAIGGGGGLGGMARTIAFQVGGAPSETTTRTATVSVGGTGGDGAVGGLVDVTNTGVIYTQGEASFGVRAQSIGGGGGIGGAVLQVRAQGTNSNDSFDLNIGGSGGTGGAGGVVQVLNEGLIVTEGRGAAGISANSIGGGGGDGGLVIDVVGGYTGADKQSHRYVLNVGGSGGDGGTGGDVTVTNRAVAGIEDSGTIATSGDRAYGVFAQSLGGGGGNGSTILSLTALKSAENSASVGLNIGGIGGTGNSAGTVKVDNAGLIQTTGDDAYGVLAQSIGGGGGNGGLVIAANLLIGATANSPLVSLGGLGGDGGDGGSVTVDNSGRILTTGARAHGIVAQSIGGGGGDAQMGFSLTGEAKSLIISNALAAIVGAVGGGSGGQGGDVTVNHSGDITVLGDGAMAIKAESINGGGGTLTLDFSGIVGLPGQPYLKPDGSTGRVDPMVVAKAGAENTSSAAGGKVTVNSTGTFGAAGDNGVGSFAQSIGGGGGTIDLNLLLAAELDEVNVDAPVGTQVQLGLGGSGGSNVGGGVIDSTHTGQILTTDANTPAVLVQSIGGGGGRATGDVTVPTGALLGLTTLTLGGENQTGAAGGDVSRTQGGAVVTTADNAFGAILQSVGGGGGSTGFTVQGAGASAVASLGATGGSGLGGGAVQAAFTGGVATLGDHATGLLVQSIGAGGGEVHLSGVSSLGVTLGGTSGAAGDGGDVALVNTGAVYTAGDGSHGVFLQSIGGGGGAVFGGPSSATVTLNDGGVGDGGDIDFSQAGDIVAEGAGSYGVVAQSLGGGGGWVDGKFAGSAGGAGEGGAIDLVLAGQVLATGAGSTAVFAQSLGEDGAGDIAVSTTNFVRGGSGTGAGVQFSGGAANTLANTGLVSAVSGNAIVGGIGDERIDNRGVVIGDIDLGEGSNAFDNKAAATFMAFKTIDLRDPAGTGPLSVSAVSTSGLSTQRISAQAVPGGAATFTNAGEFLMGLSASRTPIDLAAGATFANLDAIGTPATNPYYGARVINTVALDGHYVQTSTGHLAFDVAFGPYASDRVNATGDVVVAGTGDVILTWLQDSKPVTLFAAGGSVTDNGLKIADTLAMDYRIQTTSGAVQLAFNTHFDQGFLNVNGRALGRHMNSAISVGDSGGIGRLMALIGNLQAGQEATYTRIFQNLNPEPHLAPLRSQLASSNAFSAQLFGCANPTLQVDGKCSWATIERATADGESDFDTLGVKAEGGRLRGGFEQSLDGGWSFAAAAGLERLDRVKVDGVRSWSQGQGLSAGAGFKRRSGGAEMAFSLSGGWQWMETARLVELFTIGRAESDPESGYVRADARFAYVMENGRLFVRPALNVWATGLHQQRFEETGLEGMGARGLSHTQVIGTANPELTLGFVMRETAKSQAAVSFTVGGLFNSTDRIEMPFQLIGSNPSSEPADIRTALDKSGWRAGVDLHVIGDDRVSVKFNYTTEFGDRTSNQAAGLNVRVRF